MFSSDTVKEVIMQQHTLKPSPKSKHNRKRVGRGDSSGYGSYSGRGVKGQKSRSGGGVRPGFEGGQLPLYLRLPTLRGFTNISRREYSVVNVERLNSFTKNTSVTPEMIVGSGLVKNKKALIKILGAGTLSIPLNITAHKFSKTAKEKIEAAGGKVVTLS